MPPRHGRASNLRVAFSNRRHSSTGDLQTRSYSMNVKVTAVQEDLPEGLERLLGRLEAAAFERPVDPVPPVPPATPPVKP